MQKIAPKRRLLICGNQLTNRSAILMYATPNMNMNTSVAITRRFECTRSPDTSSWEPSLTGSSEMKGLFSVAYISRISIFPE